MHTPSETPIQPGIELGHVEAVERLLGELMQAAEITRQKSLIRRILETGIGLGQDETDRLDLKITTAAVEEMRSAFQLFAPYKGVPKVTVFGSARTQARDPLSQMAEGVARNLAECGWMVVTGAGPGIMEAANIGAGPERALGVSIRLPFEEAPSTALAYELQHVAMKYFFTRKLMLVKESSAFVCLPGGFGTMDETFELLTLQQTGKMVPVPIVLLDEPGGTFWTGFERFVLDELEQAGMISEGDLDRVLITDSVEEAIAEVTGFWRNYDSQRWVPIDTRLTTDGEIDDSENEARGALHEPDSQLVIRLRFAPSDSEIAELNERFSSLCAEGRIERTGPLPAEQTDRDRLDLPRIVFTPRQRAVGDLFRLIRALNELPSAMEAAEASGAGGTPGTP